MEKEKGGENIGKKGGSKMSVKAASRIQSNADRFGKNLGFKARAQKAATKNSRRK